MKRPSQDLSLTLLAYGLAYAGDVAAREAIASYEVELERAGVVCYDPALVAAVHACEANLRAIVCEAVQYRQNATPTAQAALLPAPSDCRPAA